MYPIYEVKKMIRKDPELLKNLVEQILMKVGSNFDNAHRVAEALVLSNLVGIDTHGIWHMRMIVSKTPLQSYWHPPQGLALSPVG